jgi:riboflavin synthase
LFTGLIEELGTVAKTEERPGGMYLSIHCGLVADGTADGDSISVNGVCLTATDVSPRSFGADLSRETLDRSTLGSLGAGSRVNLERAVTPSTRLGGHIVQGHVDGRGRLLSAERAGEFRSVRIGFPADLARYFVEKGSVAVEGISLTIASLAADHFEVAVIPKTWEMTNLAHLATGDPVNLEVDIIAKYVERLMIAR